MSTLAMLFNIVLELPAMAIRGKKIYIKSATYKPSTL